MPEVEHEHTNVSPAAARAARHRAEVALAVADAEHVRTEWLYRHLCDALGATPAPFPTHRDWDLAVAHVRVLAERAARRARMSADDGLARACGKAWRAALASGWDYGIDAFYQAFALGYRAGRGKK